MNLQIQKQGMLFMILACNCQCSSHSALGTPVSSALAASCRRVTIADSPATCAARAPTRPLAGTVGRAGTLRGSASESSRSQLGNDVCFMLRTVCVTNEGLYGDRSKTNSCVVVVSAAL